MNIRKMTLGPLATNCYIVWDENKEACIFDPADESEVIIQKVDELGVKPNAILLTHAHFDHIGGLEAVRNYFNIPVYIHEAEKDWLVNPKLNGSELFGLGRVKAQPADKIVAEGSLKVGQLTLEARHTPGHSLGGIAYVIEDLKAVIGGDSLFAGGIGRTDLPEGNQEQLIKSIQSKFYTLPDDYTVYPGHGPVTVIYEEKLNNPFVPR